VSYKSSPRPVFDRACAIPYASVTRHVWGEEASGEVADWIYVSSPEIHQLLFGLPPGAGFRHSESYRTVFGADEVLYVLQGTMVIANPETGDVRKVERGEAIFFRKDTWHHAWAYGAEELRVLEYFAPPPSTGSSGPYARTRPYVKPEESLYDQPALMGRWPMERERRAASFTHLADRDLLWRLDAPGASPVLSGLYAATDHLTVGKTILLPGQKSALMRHAGGKGFYVLSGWVNLKIEDAAHEGPSWFELHPADGAYAPPGIGHRLYNMSAEPAELLWGVAPHFHP
jgi:quercetin dioxygenase-like cupin family protein